VSRGVLSSANDDDGGGSKARCASSSQKRELRASGTARRRSAGGDGGTTLFRSASSDEDGGNLANIAASGASDQTARCASTSQIEGRLLVDQRPQHVLHDSAIAVVVGLAWSVDPHHRVEADITGFDLDRLRRTALVELSDPGDVKDLLTG
jgi:hypothetical protein